MKFPRASYTYAIEDTRHAHAARRPKIRGSHHQNLKAVTRIFFFMVYYQNYHNCSTLPRQPYFIKNPPGIVEEVICSDIVLVTGLSVV
jgi:hypothetical protein